MNTIKEEKKIKVENKIILQKFFFPKENKTVKAENIQKAILKLKK